jgi:hypothetical protein
MPLTHLWLVVGLATSTGAAQNPVRPPTPRAAVDSFFAAIASERWAIAANYLDLGSFAQYLRDRVNDARSTVPMRPTTVEDLMAADSTLPRAVAEWQIARFRGASGAAAFHDFSNEFAGITTFRALQDLTPAEGAARWLEARDPGARLRRAFAALKCPGPAVDSLLTLNPFGHRTVGVAQVNDSTAYVLAARTVDLTDSGMYAQPPSTLVVRRTSDGWRITPHMTMLSGANIVAVDPQCPRRK